MSALVMERYTHRNGETEYPTIEGRYWFRGGEKLFPIGDGNWLETIFAVTLESYNAQTWWEANDGDHVTNIDELSGKWWGPLTPPWEAVNG